MRFLIAGLVCLALAIGLTEYTRRHPTTKEPVEEAVGDPAKPKLPKAVAALLELAEAGTEPLEADAALAEVLQAPKASPLAGFAPVVEGDLPVSEQT